MSEARRPGAIAALPACLLGSRRVVFLLDYDGTLATGPPVSSTERVPPQATIEALVTLNARSTLLAIVTGRSERNLIGVLPAAEKFVVASSHGLSIRAGSAASPSISSAVALTVGADELPAIHAALEFAERELESRGLRASGVRINDEAHFFSFQVANQPAHVLEQVRALAEDAVASAAVGARIATQLSIHSLKGVIEVRPPSAASWNKGAAVTHLLQKTGLAGAPDVAIIAVGDDVSDESMFEAAVSAGCGSCMAIVVGEPHWHPTVATHTVGGPGDVSDLLVAAVGILTGRTQPK